MDHDCKKNCSCGCGDVNVPLNKENPVKLEDYSEAELEEALAMKRARKAFTVIDVAKQIKAIKEYVSKGDHEGAHGCVEDLYFRTLSAIAAGSDHAKTLATAALRAEDINYKPW